MLGLRTPEAPSIKRPSLHEHMGPPCPWARLAAGPGPTPLNGRPDLQAILSVMVVGDNQDAAGPQAVRKAEIGVGKVGQTGAHEVEEALPPDGRDLRTEHSWAPGAAHPPPQCLGMRLV